MVIPLFILGLAPAMFWLLYVYRKDRYEPEPASLILRCFISGMLISVPVALIELPFGQFLCAVIVAPIVEEMAKYYVVRKAVYSNPAFNEPMDGIIYAAAAALGFAFIENVIYFYQASQQDILLAVFVMRSGLSTPGHVLWSSVWGAALGLAKNMDATKGRTYIRRGLLLSMLFHGLFNLICLSMSTAGLFIGGGGMIAFTIFLWKAFKQRIRNAEVASPFATPSKLPEE